MNIPANNFIQERFARNGITYDCTIAPNTYAASGAEFQVMLVNTRDSHFSMFNITPSGDGHWLPDNRQVVDPWLADIIGKLILDNY
jgi:hypothetical protein